MLELYENIKKIRKEKNISQQKLAEMVGYADKSMISKIEKGEVDLSRTKIIEIAKALQVDPGILFGSNDKPQNKIVKIKPEDDLLLKIMQNYYDCSEEKRKELFNYSEYLKNRDWIIAIPYLLLTFQLFLEWITRSYHHLFVAYT